MSNYTRRAVAAVLSPGLAVLAALTLHGIAVAQSPPTAPAQQASASAADAFRKAEALEQRKEYSEAMHWYRLAADQGSVDALVAIGNLYGLRQGAQPDYATALVWYRKAAERGNPEAQDDVGFFYMNGMGVQQDFAEAMRWLRKAADQGNEVAERNIGMMYLNGLGVAVNREEALRWFRKAAAKGDSDSKEALRMLGGGS
jgi:TPR repeat protein